jgi:hypothetical protein
MAGLCRLPHALREASSYPGRGTGAARDGDRRPASTIRCSAPIDAERLPHRNGAAAHDFTNLLENGLVRVAIPLPANVKLLDCGRRSHARHRRSPTE